MRRILILATSLVLMAAAPLPKLEVNAGMLSVQAQGVPLADALGAIGRQAGFQTLLMGSGDAAHSAPVDADFTAVPLAQGIKRLLRGWNYVLQTEPGTGAPLRLYVLGRIRDSAAAEPGSEPIETKAYGRIALIDNPDTQKKDFVQPQAEPLTTDIINRQMTAADPEQRLAALQNMATVGSDDATLEQLRRLAEHDPATEVRVAALDEMIQTDPSDESIGVLRRLAAGAAGPSRDLARDYLESLDQQIATNASASTKKASQ